MLAHAECDHLRCADNILVVPYPALDPASGPAPDLIVTVTGSVLHGPSVMSSGTANPPPQDLPRKFHEMFMLRAAEQGEGMQPKVSLVVLVSELWSADCVRRHTVDKFKD